MMQGITRRIPVAVAALSVVTAAGGWALWAAPAGASATFSPELTPVEAPSSRIAQSDSAPYTLRKVTSKKTTEVVKLKQAKAQPRANTRAKTRTLQTKSAKRSGSSTRETRSASSGSSLSKAQSLLNAQIRRHPILKGTTVSFGDARGHQAIAYYGSGRIVISRNHTASLERIIAHEVWHIIDWRDNGRIDWGENVPR